MTAHTYDYNCSACGFKFAALIPCLKTCGICKQESLELKINTKSKLPLYREAIRLMESQNE